MLSRPLDLSAADIRLDTSIDGFHRSAPGQYGANTEDGEGCAGLAPELLSMFPVTQLYEAPEEETDCQAVLTSAPALIPSATLQCTPGHASRTVSAAFHQLLAAFLHSQYSIPPAASCLPAPALAIGVPCASPSW